MKVQVEVSILEKSILVGLIQNSIEEYLNSPHGNIFSKQESLRVISEELEKVKKLNLISFYGVESHLSFDACTEEKEND